MEGAIKCVIIIIIMLLESFNIYKYSFNQNVTQMCNFQIELLIISYANLFENHTPL